MGIESLWGIKVTVVVLNLAIFFTPVSLLPLYGTIKMSVLAHLIILTTAVAYMCILYFAGGAWRCREAKLYMRTSW